MIISVFLSRHFSAWFCVQFALPVIVQTRPDPWLSVAKYLSQQSSSVWSQYEYFTALKQVRASPTWNCKNQSLTFTIPCWAASNAILAIARGHLTSLDTGLVRGFSWWKILSSSLCICYWKWLEDSRLQDSKSCCVKHTIGQLWNICSLNLALKRTALSQTTLFSLATR